MTVAVAAVDDADDDALLNVDCVVVVAVVEAALSGRPEVAAESWQPACSS